jgi:hypothetical protein
VLKHCANSLGLIVGGDYLEESAEKYECMLLFNFKAKSACNRSGQRPDLLAVLSYCLRHLEGSGYLVYGDYFERGELPTFLALFQAYNLRVADQEDLTKNIDYARKLARLRRPHPCEQRLLDRLLRWGGEAVGRRPYEEGRQFHVLILERVEE